MQNLLGKRWNLPFGGKKSLLETLTDIIKEHLERKGLSQRYLAKKVAMSPSNLGKKLAKASIETDLLKLIIPILGAEFAAEVMRFFLPEPMRDGAGLPATKSDRILADVVEENIKLKRQVEFFKTSLAVTKSQLNEP